MNPTIDNLGYYIQTEHPAGCTATDLKGKTLNSTRSNRQSKLKITGSPDNYFSNLNLMIWPNPGSGIYNLSIENNSNEKIMLKIYDISGKLVFINEYLNYSNTFETEIGYILASKWYLSSSYSYRKYNIPQGINKRMKRIILFVFLPESQFK